MILVPVIWTGRGILIDHIIARRSLYKYPNSSLHTPLKDYKNFVFLEPGVLAGLPLDHYIDRRSPYRKITTKYFPKYIRENFFFFKKNCQTYKN